MDLGKSRGWCNNTCISGDNYFHPIGSFLLISLPFVIMLIILIETSEYHSIVAPLVLTTIFYAIAVFSTFRGGFSDPGILQRQTVNNK